MLSNGYGKCSSAPSRYCAALLKYLPFFIEDSSQHHLQNHQEAYKEERKSPSPSTPHVVQESHPSSSFHPTSLNETKPSIEQLLSALNLDKERLLILALLFLLYTDGADQTLLLALLYLFFE